MKNKISIVDELEKLGIELTRSGKRYKCCCPLHKEKTPSMFVNPETNTFKCFGCGEGGNVYKLLSKIKNVPIASFFSRKVTLSDEIKANNCIAKFYNTSLTQTKIGVKVLEDYKARGLTTEVCDYFNIGFAPKKDSILDLLKDLHNQTNPQTILTSTNLFSSIPLINDGKDFFKNRIMFPIYSLNGNVLGFTGRTISKDNPVKYLNTPETDEFKKNNILFNFYNAIAEIKKQKRIYLVEGPFDVIAYHLAGYKNVVSPLTCNISENQLSLILNNCGSDLEFIIAFDNDKAGLKGIKNTMELFKKNMIWNYKIINYSFKDAGEYVEKDKLDNLIKIIESPLDISEYMSKFYKISKATQSKMVIIKTFVSMIYSFPDLVSEPLIKKFEKLTSDKTHCASEEMLKRKKDKEIIKLIFAQLLGNKEKRKLFDLSVSRDILTKEEIDILNDLKTHSFNDYKNNYELSYLIALFIKIRVQFILQQEEVF